MAGLRKPSWEMFAQGIADGLSNGKAYERAGYRPSRSAASELRRRPEITARIEELISEQSVQKARVAQKATEQAIKRTGITKAKVIEELATMAFAGSESRIKPADRRNALMAISQLNGWIIEKQEQGPPGAFDDLTDEQLEEHLVRRLADRGLDEKRARALVRARVVNGGGGAGFPR